VNQELLNFIGLHCHIYTDDFGVLSQDQLLHTKRHAEKSCVTCSKHTTWSRSKKYVLVFLLLRASWYA